MGATKTTKKPLKATFTTKSVNGKRLFTPVNKRAKAFTLIAHSNVLKVSDLRKIKEAGYRPYEYVDGKLKSIAL